jgi:alkylhydroperoxidase family enzyme
MGQASRTNKLLLDVGKRTQGGANSEKRAALAATAAVLTAARADLTLACTVATAAHPHP